MYNKAAGEIFIKRRVRPIDKSIPRTTRAKNDLLLPFLYLKAQFQDELQGLDGGVAIILLLGLRERLVGN
jgi:hypothetical protein